MCASCACYHEFVFVGEFVNAEDGDDVLQFVVFLKELLDGLCGVVVLFAYDIGVKDSRGGLQGVYGGVYAQLCDFTGKYRCGVQERERSCRCGVGKVVGGDVYGLYRGD